MKGFAALFQAVDQTTKTTAKVAALEDYFREASEEDRLWCIALFTGRRPKRRVTTTLLRQWAAERADIPLWLFEDSYGVVGDLAETIALVLPEPSGVSDRSLSEWIAWAIALGDLEEAEKKAAVLEAWNVLPARERFLFNKLLTGGFRIGVSAKLVTRALARATDQEEAVVTHKLMGNWSPETTSFDELVLAEDPGADLSRPYPFYLAYQLEDVDALGPPEDWTAEWKWDGIRGQIIRRGGEVFVWSRGEELMTDRFPEFSRLLDFVPDGTVLDGEILVWKDGAPMPFSALQPRIGRKSVPAKLLREAPVALYAYDLLEFGGADFRSAAFAERRENLQGLVQALPEDVPLRLSPQVDFASWEALADIRQGSRDIGAEGLMLKRRDSPYLSGRKKGDWWKWKVDPLTIDAVMIYAQAGHGRRANLFTDFTFAVRKGEELVPFAKAYSGLTDDEFRQITAWVKKNTLQRFGPVRQVKPEHVFEIAFEGIQKSTRHKSGVALRFPRMSRWRQDKPVAEANSYEDLLEMLEVYG